MFSTGNAFSGTKAFYCIPVDSARWVDMELESALLPLTRDFNWDMVGAVTPSDAAHTFARAFEDMFVLPDPAGMIIPWGGNPASVPKGALLCDGTLYNTADYPALFTAVGYTFGGSGAIFAVPDLTNRVPLGEGGTIGGVSQPVGSIGGELTHTLTESELPVLAHAITPHAHTYLEPIITPSLIQVGAGAAPTPVPSITGTSSDGIANHGAGGVHNNVQPYMALCFLILTGQ